MRHKPSINKINHVINTTFINVLEYANKTLQSIWFTCHLLFFKTDFDLQVTEMYTFHPLRFGLKVYFQYYYFL